MVLQSKADEFLPDPVRRPAVQAHGVHLVGYPELSVEKNEAQRRLWDYVRERLRSEWSSKLGNWPTNNKGNPWSGHHVHDLKHGGPPASLENILPAPADTHIVFNKEYPRCYDGASWMKVGPDLPYTD
jgi:hypothetical protein